MAHNRNINNVFRFMPFLLSHREDGKTLTLCTLFFALAPKSQNIKISCCLLKLSVNLGMKNSVFYSVWVHREENASSVCAKKKKKKNFFVFVVFGYKNGKDEGCVEKHG